MAMHDKENSRTVMCIILGIAVYFVIVSIPVLIFAAGDRFRWEAGLALGCVIACIMTLHMNYAIGKSFDMSRHNSAYLAWTSIGRMALVAIVLALFAYTGWLNAFAILTGIFGLKISAHMQPLFYKLLQKIKNKEGEKCDGTAFHHDCGR